MITSFKRQQEAIMGSLPEKELAVMDAYWRAIDHPSIGQIKPRLLRGQ